MFIRRDRRDAAKQRAVFRSRLGAGHKLLFFPEGTSTDGLRVDYRLRPNGSTWLVIDVIIEGVSFVANYRAQFKEVLLNSEPDRLIEILRTKNAESSRSGAKPN